MLTLDSRVLVVDDMPAIRILIVDMLQQLGFREIVEAEDGESAWDLLRGDGAGAVGRGDPKEARFALVVADWSMPGMSGVELLRAVRGFRPTGGTPFLMVTGQRDREHFAEAFGAGVTDFLVKPFDLGQLREKLGPLLSPQSAETMSPG
jgi:two-component system chemotaxis response regulator CheY